MRYTMLLLTAVSASAVGLARAADPALNFNVVNDQEIIIDGVTYDSWGAVSDSGYFAQLHTRCATDRLAAEFEGPLQRGGSSAADCSSSLTNPLAIYAPEVVRYRIPVVFHVISRTNGTGNLSDASVTSQIDILNEDFLALAGTNGAPGTDVQVEFYLATEDPNGNPTTGITRSVNNTWFNDGGSYWNTLAWDTNHYLNIYSNNAGGALGYVPALPANSGIVGQASDRVVVLYSSVGRNAPLSGFDLGRTGTHEVGHYLGLFHTFSSCTNTSCYTQGDRICDTNPESSPTFGCPGNRTSCGVTAPFHNYMDYADDICMWEFTPEQARRMRCTLENWRPDLYEIVGDGPCAVTDVAEPFGELNIFDVVSFITVWNSGANTADFNDDNMVNIFDVVDFITEWSNGCP